MADIVDPREGVAARLEQDLAPLRAMLVDAADWRERLAIKRRMRQKRREARRLLGPTARW